MKDLLDKILLFLLVLTAYMGAWERRCVSRERRQDGQDTELQVPQRGFRAPMVEERELHHYLCWGMMRLKDACG